MKEKMSEENIEKINSKCSEIEEWLSEDDNNKELDDFENKKEELEQLLKQIHEEDISKELDTDKMNVSEESIEETIIDEVD